MVRPAVSNAPVPVRLYVLGPFRLGRGSQSIRLPTHKTESLLAFLALSPTETSHSREKLAALLWGDSPDQLARSSLRRALMALRRALGDDLVLASRDAVQLNPEYPLWVDAVEFEAQAQVARAAPGNLEIELYRDDLLVEFYDEWVPPLREHFRSLFIGSLIELAEHARRNGDYDRAVLLARTVLQRDATNELAHQQLMFSYWKTGKRSAALSQFKECERILAQELGVPPSAETTALNEKIRQDVSTASQVPESRVSNLPIPLSSFIGRGRELAQVKDILRTTRLLTLTGAGGSGKTRLAIEAAAILRNDFADGVSWVDLAQLIDSTLLAHTVAQALGIYETTNRPPSEAIASYLHQRQLLLVLDNCEHLIDACAELAETLLRTCAQLKILATSRQVLNVAGETAWIVPSLGIPVPSQQMPPDFGQHEAIQLFVERARAAQPRFKVTPENWQAVDRICRRLDGIPLAIELAASRVKVLNAGEIESHLDERFQFWVGTNRTALPRHRTLRATMDWSYALLDEPQRIFLRRLAVFSGGFTLEAAAHVCGQEPLDARDVLTLLSSLADKSLVLVEENGGVSRYRLLETIRQYALERLLEAREGELFYEQHLNYILEFAARVQLKLMGAEQKTALHQLEAEQDNIRAVLHRALDNPACLHKGVRLANLLWRYWVYRGEMSEGRSWLQRGLASLLHPEEKQALQLRAETLTHLGCLAWLQEDYPSARAALEESVKLSQELQDVENLAWGLDWLSMTVTDQDNAQLACGYAEEAFRLFEQLDDPWGMAHALFVRGKALLSLGDFDDARIIYEASVTRFRKLGDRWGSSLALGHLGKMAYHQQDYATARRFLVERLTIGREFQAMQLVGFAVGYLGWLCLRMHEYEQAKQYFAESLQLAMESGRKGTLYNNLEGLGELACGLGQEKRAVHLFAAADALRRGLSTDYEREARERAAALDELRSRMNEQAFGEAWAEGQAMPLEEAVRYALADI